MEERGCSCWSSRNTSAKAEGDKRQFQDVKWEWEARDNTCRNIMKSRDVGGRGPFTRADLANDLTPV